MTHKLTERIPFVPLKLSEPVFCPHAYSIDLYCDHANEEDHPYPSMEFPHCLFGKSRADVFRQARKLGWIINPDNSATCPKCAKRLRRKRR